MDNIIVAPSILSADFANLERDIKTLEKAGANWIHVDVMDGHFVPNITIGVPVVKSIRKVTKLPLDVHLMVEKPFNYIPAFIDVGADIVTVHYEACIGELDDLIEYVHARGKKIGVSIKPKTPPQVLAPYLKKIDLALIMTVEPGFGGQAFMEDASYKVEYARNNGHKDLIVEVDGGINEETAKICKHLGANALVAGNYIFKAFNIEQAIRALR